MLVRCQQGTIRRWAAAGAAFALALASVPVTAAAASAQPVAHAATTCSLVGKYRSLGPSYAEALTVSHTSCKTGDSVITSYNKCRLKAGGVKGYCHSRVLGFACSEKRPQTSSIQFIAEVRCANGSESVKFTYSENT
jgi:hypothetical protein